MLNFWVGFVAGVSINTFMYAILFCIKSRDSKIRKLKRRNKSYLSALKEMRGN